MQQNSRRGFFKSMLGVVGLLMAGQSVFAEEKRRAKPSGDAAAAGDMPLAEPGKDMAGSLGYMHKSNQPDKKCANCMQYTPNGKKNGEDVGKCNVIPGKLVKATGYCNSWTKKV